MLSQKKKSHFPVISKQTFELLFLYLKPSIFVIFLITTVKPVLRSHSNTKRQNKDLNDNGRLMKVKSIAEYEGRKYCRMLPFGAFCITFDMH